MSGVLAIARNDLRQTLSTRAAVLWMFVFPVLFALFFGVVTGGNGAGEEVPGIAVADRDGGPLAGLLVEELGRSGLAVVEERSGEEGGDLPVLEIPPGFGRDMLSGKRVVLRLRGGGGGGEEGVAVEARVFAAVARVIGAVAARAGAGPAGEVPAEESFAGYEGPEDLVRVESSFAGKARTVPAGFAQSVPGDTVMFMLLVALTWGAAAFARERRQGVLARLAAAPIAPGAVVLGKIAGRLLVALVQAAVLVAAAAAGVRLFGLPLSGDPLAAFAVLAVYALAVAPLGVLLGAAIREPARAANAGVLVALVLSALGGCWWPLEVVPPWLQAVGRALPTGWAMTALHRLLSFGGGLADTAPWLGALAAFGCAAAAAARRFVRIS
ncbi:MAG: ABC transporter permease [Acidobacteria bacterium]|nr:MAG: ABC transporter permease [Acidobacteriota bacterium]